MGTRISFGLFQLVIGLFLIMFQGYSQEQVEQYNSNGLSTTIFKTSLAKITVYLPEHTAKESISGTILIEPHGNSNKRKVKNATEIKQYRLSLGNISISLQAKSFGLLTSDSNNNRLQLFNNRGKLIAVSNIKINRERLSSKSSTYIPEYMVSGAPTKITSTCDGNLENNNVSINNQNVPILAESESGVFFIAPDINGSSQLQFTNEGVITEATVNVLGLDLSVGRTNLLRGETTNLSIKVSGLDGLGRNVPITITNNSTSNITLEGGNVQQLVINPANDASSGNYFKSMSVRALQRGNFSISVNVIPPTSSETTVSSEELLCNCYLNGQSYLISPSACEELGGYCSENIEETTTDFIEDETPPNFEFDFPEEIVAQDGVVNLRINDLKKNDCIAVVFSYRLIDDEQWQFIGADNTVEDGLSFNWSLPSENDGVYVLRAKVVNVNNISSEKLQYAVFNVAPQTKNEDSLNVLYSISMEDINREIRKARATGKRIKEEEEKLDSIGGLKDKRWDADDSKKENEAAKNELIAIDKVLDSIPKTYKNDLKRILDSLASIRKKLPDVVDPSVLQKAIDDAQSRVDDCNKRLEALKKEQADLETERDRLKQELDEIQEALHKLFTDNGWIGGYGYHPDGRPWHGYMGGERSTRRDFGNSDFGKEVDKLKKQYHELKKQYLKTLKRLGNLPAEILEAEEDCEELNKALEKAKNAKENVDLHAATELEADDICRQIKRLLHHLRQWCSKNPKHCDFKEKIKELTKKCPKDSSELEEFWKAFNEIINRKKKLEDNFGDAADADQDTIDTIEEEIERQKAKIRGLKDQQDKEFEEAGRLRRQLNAEAAAAAKRKAASDKKRKERKKSDKKIKDLIKKAKSSEAGDDAFEDLLEGMGLSLLDDATGAGKLGTLIGGILAVKDMPDCACKMFKLLKEAISAQLKGKDILQFVFANEYLREWNSCANLPVFSSIMIGAKELSDAIGSMSEAQCRKAIEVLEQAMRIQCK